MFNITGGEVIIIAIVALVILGPDKLPDFIRRAGRLYGEAKKISNGFKTEFRDAIEEPVREMQDTVNLAKSWFDEGKTAVGTLDDMGWNTSMTPDAGDTKAAASTPEPAQSPAVDTGVDQAMVFDSPDQRPAETGGFDHETGDGLSDGADDDDADDDPNFYDDFGNMITSLSVDSLAENGADDELGGPTAGPVDRFGALGGRPSAEGTDA